MNFPKKLENISRILITNDEIIVSNHDIKIANYSIPIKPNDYYFTKNGQLYLNRENHLFFYDSNEMNFARSKVPKSDSFLVISMDKIICLVEGDLDENYNFSTEYSLFNKSNKFTNRDIQGFIRYYNNETIIADNGSNPNIYLSLSVEDFSTRWRLELKDNYGISKKIIHSSNCLCIPTKSGKLIGIDCISGQRIWEADYTYVHLIVNAINGRIICFGGNLKVIDPMNGELVFENNDFEYLESQGVLVSQHQISTYNNLLFFASNYETNKWGYYDLDNYEIQNIIELPDYIPGETIHPPIYHKGKVYVLRTNGDLFIYDLEETA